MAFTTTDLQNLETAIASGRRRVKLNGREVEYQSIADMIEVRNIIRSELNTSTSTTCKRPRGYRARTNKGL